MVVAHSHVNWHVQTSQCGTNWKFGPAVNDDLYQVRYAQCFCNSSLGIGATKLFRSIAKNVEMWLFVWEVFIIQVLILTVACCFCCWRLHFDETLSNIQRRWDNTSIFRYSSSTSLILTSLFILTVFIVCRQNDKHNLKGVWVMLSIVSMAFWLIYFSDCLVIGSEKKGESVKFEQRLWNLFRHVSNFSIGISSFKKNYYPLRYDIT